MAPALQDHLQLGPDQDAVRADVQTYYGTTLQATTDLKTSACCTSKAPPKEVIEVLQRVPEEIKSRYYGCGSPFPQGIQGRRILDLGCGTGRDCYVCAALVGEKGHVTGVDMTPEQLSVARRHSDAWTATLGYAQPNMTFVEGQIERLAEAGVARGSIDLAISNCVINLSPDKPACLRGVFDALAPGGEMFFSDVYCDRRLPAAIRSHTTLLGECLGGALYFNDFVALARSVGFSAPRLTEVEAISVDDQELAALLDGARFFSATLRLFKLPGSLDELPEDYKQTATYKGTIPQQPKTYTLDGAFAFPAGTAVPVDGNTALVLEQSWLAAHFEVSARGPHKGMWQGSGSGAVTVASLEAVAAPASGGSCCPPAAAPAPAAVSPAAAGATSNGCCGPAKDASSCCPPAAAAPEQRPFVCGTVAPAAAAQNGCCDPKAASAPAAAPVSASGGCCGPKAATAAATVATAPATNGCCGPKAAPAPGAASGGCCPSPAGAPAESVAAEPAAAANGCCAAPKAARKGCCGPAAAPSAAAKEGVCGTAAAPEQQAAKPSACGGGKCC